MSFERKKNDHKKISRSVYWQQLFLSARVLSSHRDKSRPRNDASTVQEDTSPTTSIITPKPIPGYESNIGLVNGLVRIYVYIVELTGDDLMQPVYER